MKNIICTILIILILIALAACSNEESYIDNYTNGIDFIVQMENNALSELSTGTNSMLPIELGNINIEKIDKIKKFRGKYYLISRELKKIFALTAKTYEIAEVDYSVIGLTPTDICFPNATDAYVLHGNSGVVTILDMTTNRIANSQINVGGYAENIAGFGNQVYLTLPNKNVLEIIDTRYNIVVDSVAIADTPKFVSFTNDGAKAIVVSTDIAKVSEVDVVTRKITKDVMIGDASAKITPNSLAVSSTNIYVSATNADVGSTLWRISTNGFKSAVSMSKNAISYLAYSLESDVLYAVENTANAQLTLYDAKSNLKIKSITLPSIPNVIIIK